MRLANFFNALKIFLPTFALALSPHAASAAPSKGVAPTGNNFSITKADPGPATCGNPMELQIAFFGLPPSSARISGTASVQPQTGWTLTPGTVRQDFTLSSRCLVVRVLEGNHPLDTGIAFEFTCEPEVPEEGFTLRVLAQGINTGGPIAIRGQADVVEPQPQTIPDRLDLTPVGCDPASLHLAKSDGNITAVSGQLITYTLTGNNTGATAIDTVLRETVPQHTTFEPAASSPGWNCLSPHPGGTCELALGAIPTGGAFAATFSVRSGHPLPAGVTSIRNTATVTSAIEEADTTDNTASTTTPIVAAVPDIRLVKSLVSSSGIPGTPIVWQLTATNIGTSASGTVLIQDQLPAVADALVGPGSSSGWDCGPTTCQLTLPALQPGESASRTIALRIRNPVPAGTTQANNQACASSTGDSNAGNDCSSSATQIVASPNLRVSKSLQSGSATPGSILTYRILVINDGTQDSGNVQLTENIPLHTSFEPGSSGPWTCGPKNCSLTLQPIPGGGGQSSALFAVRVASPLPAGVSQISNTACVGSPPRCDEISVPTDGSPSISITKTVTTPAVPGRPLTYRLTLRNAGDQDASNVLLVEQVPEHTTFDSNANPGWNCNGSTCTLLVASVPAGGTETVRTFTVVVDSPLPPGVTEIGNTACARHQGQEDCDTVDVPSGGAPQLAILKTASPTSPRPRELLTYTLTVRNSGNQDALTTLTETIPNWTTLEDAPGWTCDGTGGGSNCTRDLSLPAFETVELTFQVRLLSVVPPWAEIRNTACIAAPGTAQVCSSVTTPPGGVPNLTFEKTYDGPPLTAGAILPFTLIVTNSGDGMALDVELSETVPPSTTFDELASSHGWVCQGSSCRFPLPEVGADSISRIVFAVRAPDPLPAGVDQIANSACLTYGQVTLCDDASTPSPALLAATLRDTLSRDVDGDGNPDPGDELSYELLVSNPGKVALLNVLARTQIDPVALELVVGSVEAPDATVTAGNQPGETLPIVLIQELLPNQTVRITFRTIVTEASQSLTLISSQAFLSSPSAASSVSDDPDTAEPLDPTLTPRDGQAGPEPVPIPTLGHLGAFLLVGALAGVAFTRLRRQGPLG